MFRLALNAGHGVNTPGKRCLKSIDADETREWVLNSRICSKIEERLANYDGVEVKRIDDVTGVKDILLAERAATANAFNADLYLSIHHNAGISGGSGGGIMAFTYLTVDEKTKDYQKKFYDAAIKFTGLKGNRSNPLGRQDLGECRMTKMPAILMECGFMDSVTDTPVILTVDFAESIADACTQVIVAESGATPKSGEENNAASQLSEEHYQNTVEFNTSGVLYRVRKSYDNTDSQIGAFSVLDNAITLAKQAHYNVFDVSGKCIWSYNEYILSELSHDNNETKKVETSQEQSENESHDNSGGILKLLKRILNLLNSIIKK